MRASRDLGNSSGGLVDRYPQSLVSPFEFKAGGSDQRVDHLDNFSIVPARILGCPF